MRKMRLSYSLLSQWGKELDCQTCDDRLREERGHDREGVIPFMVNGERVFRCPLTLITNSTWAYIKAFNFYEKNILPNGSAWGNESRKFNQAMVILGNEFNREKDKKNG